MKTEIKKEQVYIPVKDYAIKYEESVHNVYNLIKRGNVQGKKIGSYQLVLDTPKA